MARALDAHGAKIHRQHIERRFGAALQGGRQQGGEAVRAEMLHGFDQQGTRGTAGKRFDQRCRQGIDELRVHPRGVHQPADAVQQYVQGAGGAQHAHRAQHGHQIGQQAFADVKTVLGTFDEAFVDGNALPGTCDKKGDQDAEQHQIAQQRGQGRDRGRAHRSQQRHETAQQQRRAAQPRQHHGVMQPQPLHECNSQQPGQGRCRGRQQDRQEHQCRVGGALLGPVHEDGHRQQGQRRGIQHQEQDLCVAGGFGFGIQRLQRVHRPQADRCGGVVQSQGIGSEVQRDQAQCRMPGRHFRHQAPEQRSQQTRQAGHQTGGFGNAQKTHPERQRAKQQQHQLDRQVRHVEQAGDQAGEHPWVAQDQPLKQRGSGRDQKEPEPEDVQHAAV